MVINRTDDMTMSSEDINHVDHYSSIAVSTNDEPTCLQADLNQTVLLTLSICAAFVVLKTSYEKLCNVFVNVTIVVIGGGPIGLLSAIIAAKSGRASKIIVYEQKSRKDLLNHKNAEIQICLEPNNIEFLQSLGIDFDNIEGCWDKGHFYTSVSVILDYLLYKIQRLTLPIDLRFGTKFNKECLVELDRIPDRVIAIACDTMRQSGTCGRLLGLSDEYEEYSCHAYGATAVIYRPHQCSIPVPEHRIHNINFDLTNYDSDTGHEHAFQGFHVKLFGCMKQRCLSIALSRSPRKKSLVINLLKQSRDNSILRNIFKECFNTYRTKQETVMSDSEADQHMKLSSRLHEIKMLVRRENITYVQDANIFVLTEGATARHLNFFTGLDINLALEGLTSLNNFLQMAATARTEVDIKSALSFKHNHSKQIVKDFIKHGIENTMYS